MPPVWLPKLVTLADHDGNWDQYLDAVYAVFKTDFVDSLPSYQGRRMGLKRHPVEAGKEATFWHFVSEGRIEADRLPDLRRCERIGWPRAIIENCGDASLKTWSEDVGGDTRIHIWCEDAEYLLVIADRGGYVLPWTGYPVIQAHQQRKLTKRWIKATSNG